MRSKSVFNYLKVKYHTIKFKTNTWDQNYLFDMLLVILKNSASVTTLKSMYIFNHCRL